MGNIWDGVSGVWMEGTLTPSAATLVCFSSNFYINWGYEDGATLILSSISIWWPQHWHRGGVRECTYAQDMRKGCWPGRLKETYQHTRGYQASLRISKRLGMCSQLALGFTLTHPFSLIFFFIQVCQSFPITPYIQKLAYNVNLLHLEILEQLKKETYLFPKLLKF